MTKKFIMPLLLVGLLILVGCGNQPAANLPAEGEGQLPVDILAPEEQVQPTQEESSEEVVEEPAIEPTPTPVPRPTSKAAICVTPSEHARLETASYSEFPQQILDYLNSGATPEELAVELIVGQLSPDDQPVWAEDLTQDGIRDVVVTVLDKQNPPRGAMMIFTCQGSEFVVSHVTVAEPDHHAPKLLHIQDLNDDGLWEVVYTSTICGAHTCYEDIQILSWESGVFVTRLEGSTADLPYPNVQLTDFDRDGSYNLEVVGTAIGSVGAGPQRDSINIWSYDPNSDHWKLTEQTLASSPFRVHVLHDAEGAMDREEYLIASLLFQQVIEDETLLEWSNPEDEYNTLAAYAYYKRIVANVFLGDRGAALTLYDELDELYSKTDQYAYVRMADAFLTDSEVLGLEGGCTAARQYAASNASVVLTPLGSSVYGYANPDFEAEDMCP